MLSNVTLGSGPHIIADAQAAQQASATTTSVPTSPSPAALAELLQRLPSPAQLLAYSPSPFDPNRSFSLTPSQPQQRPRAINVQAGFTDLLIDRDVALVQTINGPIGTYKFYESFESGLTEACVKLKTGTVIVKVPDYVELPRLDVFLRNLNYQYIETENDLTGLIEALPPSAAYSAAVSAPASPMPPVAPQTVFPQFPFHQQPPTHLRPHRSRSTVPLAESKWMQRVANLPAHSTARNKDEAIQQIISESAVSFRFYFDSTTNKANICIKLTTQTIMREIPDQVDLQRLTTQLPQCTTAGDVQRQIDLCTIQPTPPNVLPGYTPPNVLPGFFVVPVAYVAFPATSFMAPAYQPTFTAQPQFYIPQPMSTTPSPRPIVGSISPFTMPAAAGVPATPPPAAYYPPLTPPTVANQSSQPGTPATNTPPQGPATTNAGPIVGPTPHISATFISSPPMGSTFQLSRPAQPMPQPAVAATMRPMVNLTSQIAAGNNFSNSGILNFMQTKAAQ